MIIFYIYVLGAIIMMLCELYKYQSYKLIFVLFIELLQSIKFGLLWPFILLMNWAFKHRA